MKDEDKTKGQLINGLMVMRQGVDKLVKVAIQGKRTDETSNLQRIYYQQLFNNYPDGIVMLDNSDRIIDANKGFETLFQYSIKEIRGKNIYDLIAPENLREEAYNLSVAVSGKEIFKKETVRKCKDGSLIDVSLIGYPIEVDNELIGAYAIYSDITERKRAEKQIEASLKEKQILLKEIHHRVKNNLQVICSMLGLQAQHIEDRQAREIFEESRNRIRSMKLVHEVLYHSEDLATINFSKYTKSLVHYLDSVYSSCPGRISLEVNVDHVSMDINLAIPCGLVMNELISNALKHAFPQSFKGKGKIEIALHKTEADEIELIVKDNGVGMPKRLDIRRTKSLGLQLVNILAEDQLGGKVKLDMRGGTKFTIRFMLDKYYSG